MTLPLLVVAYNQLMDWDMLLSSQLILISCGGYAT